MFIRGEKVKEKNVCIFKRAASWISWACILCLLSPAAKASMDFREIVTEADLYCSFMVLDEKLSDLRIAGAAKKYEKSLFSDGDIVDINKGKKDGLEKDQVFLCMEVEKISGVGSVVFKKGRARIVSLTDSQASAQLEKCCGDVRIGHYLIPFVPKEAIQGEDLGYNVPPFEVEEPKGKVIYLQTEYNQLGSGYWALINIGREHGIQLGQQLILCRKAKGEPTIQPFGNCVVIDVQNRTSTIKVLSCRDPLIEGDWVMERS